MRLTSDELKSLYQEQTSRSARRLAECLTPEALLRAAAGGLTRTERERLADHLMACADCAQEYRLVRSIQPRAEENADGVFTRPEEGRDDPDRPLRWGWLAGAFSRPRVAYALAAALFIVSLSLGVWIASLRQENRRNAARYDQELAERDQALAATAESLQQARQRLEEEARQQNQSQAQIAELRQKNEELSRDPQGLSQPQLNTPIVHLIPPTRGEGQGDTQNIEVAATARVFTLVLNVTGGETHSDYALEIENRSGRVIWQGRGLRKSPKNTFTVTVPRRLIPAGRYQIRLYGLSAGKRARVADYAVQVTYK